MSETMKKLILEFLQEKAMDLRQAYADLAIDVIEAKLMEDPPRLGVVLNAVPPWDVEFEFRDVKIVPEIIGFEARSHSQAVTIKAPDTDEQQIGIAQRVQPVSDNEFHKSFKPGCLPVPEGKEGEQIATPEVPQAPASSEDIVYHSFSPEQAKALGISEAPNPYTVDPRSGKTAFEIWKERHEKGSKK